MRRIKATAEPDFKNDTVEVEYDKSYGICIETEAENGDHQSESTAIFLTIAEAHELINAIHEAIIEARASDVE